ncbi:MAG: leucyl aminopeptidase [Bacteroidetes bacterium]|nr:leucyl aminopeptidase [Bacteroidota bacterium]
MISLKVIAGKPEGVRADLVAAIVFEDEPGFSRRMAEVRKTAGHIPPPVASGAFKGKLGQTLIVPIAGRAAHQIVLVGAGPAGRFSLEAARRISAAAIKAAMAQHAPAVVLQLPDAEELSPLPLLKAGVSLRDLALSFAEGGALAAYRFDKYRTEKENDFAGVRSFSFLVASRRNFDTYRQGVRDAALVCEATWLARDLANAPGNEIYPESLARRVRMAGRKHGFSVTVFDEKKIARLGMGGLLGVAKGSRKPPRFIIMETRTPRGRKRPTIVLVGKGITFDAGGISLKPSANMAEMKMDMSGAAAVVGALQVAAHLRLPLRLIGLIPAAENLPGGNALKPGDILRHLNGKTSEIDNTDAEGRLILADALSYASRYTPDLVIDLATLTGAVVVALGHVTTGMLGTSEPAMQQLRAAGDRTFERVWELPLFEEYEKLMKSEIADVKNAGARWAGAITGAVFLKHFIGSYPWVHLDIAGTAMLEEPGEYSQRGASGVGVRLLVDFLRHYKP